MRLTIDRSAICIILVLVASISLNLWLYIQVEQLKIEVAALKSPERLDTYTLHWETQSIPAKTKVSDFVREWTPHKPIEVMQICVWMGNPYGILWEGDIYVTLNASDLEAPRQHIFHYQFDSHAPSPIPHIYTVDLRPGFFVNEDQTIYVYRVFNNFDDEDTASGDGWIIIYFIEYF